MNRDKLTGTNGSLKRALYIDQVAFHEAGHAAAIFLRNRQLNLPSVYFHIRLVGLGGRNSKGASSELEKCLILQPILEGGLLHTESAISPGNCVCPAVDCDSCRVAYEADVINLLAGPVAEATHVAVRDGEPINRYLVDRMALKNYGGGSDLEQVDAYLNSYSSDPIKRIAKLESLYFASFEFVSQPEIWQAITRLAHYIVEREQDIVSYDEIKTVLGAPAHAAQKCAFSAKGFAR